MYNTITSTFLPLRTTTTTKIVSNKKYILLKIYSVLKIYCAFGVLRTELYIIYYYYFFSCLRPPILYIYIYYHWVLYIYCTSWCVCVCVYILLQLWWFNRINVLFAVCRTVSRFKGPEVVVFSEHFHFSDTYTPRVSFAPQSAPDYRTPHT